MLTSVIRPDGKEWKYEYPASKIDALNTVHGWLGKVTNPEGGFNKYKYDLFDLKRTRYEIVKIYRVSKKTTFENNKEIGKWDYTYGFDVGNIDRTVVRGNEGTTVYNYNTLYNALDLDVWRVGLPKEILKCDDKDCLQIVNKEQFGWGAQKISDDKVTKGSSVDIDYNAPILLSKKITRDGTTHTTSYLEHDQFGNPNVVWEPSQFSSSVGSSQNLNPYLADLTVSNQRHRQITYYNSTSKWVIGLVKKETINSKWKTENDFEANGNLKSTNQYGVKTKYIYHNSGDTKSETDNNENKTEYLDYYRGSPRLVKYPESITATYEINPTGTIKSKTNGEGETVRYTYDKMNRVATITPATGTGGKTVITRTGNKKIITRGDYENIIQYDTLGRKKESIQRDTATNKIIRTAFLYDALDRVVFKSHPTSTRDAVSYLKGEHYTYDVLDRVTSVSHPDGTKKTFTHKLGNKVTIQNERNKTYTYTYRSFGNPDDKYLIAVAAPISSANINIERNVLDQKLSMTQDGIKHQWVYNTKAFLEKKYIPETGWTSFTHDSVGNIRTKTLASNTITYSYDDNYNIKNISYADRGTSSKIFSYDKVGRVKSTFSDGARRAYTYDDNGNLTSETLDIDGLTFALGYGYNKNDALTDMTYPDIVDQKLSFHPDAFGRKTQIDKLGISISHHTNGLVEQMSYANNVHTKQVLNSRQWPEAILTQKSTTEYIDMVMEYDGLGNVLSITDSNTAMMIAHSPMMILTV